MTYKQLDIYWVDLEPTRGSETQKLRPCVIIQCDLVNEKSQTLIVAPLLPNHKAWPFAVNVTPTSKNRLDKDRHINLKQMRAVDVSRLINHNGQLEKKYLPNIHYSISIIFGL